MIQSSINITWMLQNQNEKQEYKLTIDKLAKTCRTPVRNNEINKSFTFVKNFIKFTNQILGILPIKFYEIYFKRKIL